MYDRKNYIVVGICITLFILNSKTAFSYPDSVRVTKDEREFSHIQKNKLSSSHWESDPNRKAFIEAMSRYVNSTDMKVLTELVSEDALDIRTLRRLTNHAQEKHPEIKGLDKYFQRDLNEILSAAARMEDRFTEKLETLEIPLYTLADDFPQEHVKTFNDFLKFCASLQEEKRGSIGPIYELPIVKTRLEMNNPVRYEDFLSAVLVSISFFGEKTNTVRMSGLSTKTILFYVQMFMYSSRNTFFVENILEPIRNDLKKAEYRGFHFENDNLPQYFRDFAEKCYAIRWEMFRNWAYLPDRYRDSYIEKFSISKDIYFFNYYALTFWHIHQGRLLDAYRELYSVYELCVLFELKRPLPPRPYYYYSDEDRYHWFMYLQSELRSSGHDDFADSILETEIDHFRELIVWQLKLRAYLAQKLYEYGDNFNLSTLRELLSTEYSDLRNESFLKSNFEAAIQILRDMDDKVRISPTGAEKGTLLLPWIDREAIDYRQGIISKVLSINPEPIIWRTAIESIDDETKNEMDKSFGRSMYCIRALSVICEKLYLEKDLLKMVQLHLRLSRNNNLNCTPSGVSHQDFSALKSTYGDGADISGLDSQTKLDLRRFDLIVTDFWGHQERRKNGDMTVGDIILPWVEVQDIAP